MPLGGVITLLSIIYLLLKLNPIYAFLLYETLSLNCLILIYNIGPVFGVAIGFFIIIFLLYMAIVALIFIIAVN